MASLHGGLPEGERTVRRSPADETLRRPEPESGTFAARPQMRPEEQATECFLGPQGRTLSVVRSLAPGGEGVLYLCRDGEKDCVVKVLQFESDEEILSSMARQGADLGAMHLLPLLHVGHMQDLPGHMFDTRPYIVSPYYAAGDMSVLENARRINSSITFDGQVFSGSNADCALVHCDYSAVDVLEFSRLVDQVHTAMKALHAAQIVPEMGGIVHRDIRPQNILVDATGQYVLGDFGLSTAIERGVEMKFTERFGVSHGYSPPEAYSDRIFKQSVTRKYDYFSLGMTLAHIIGGRPLYLIGPRDRQLQPYEISLTDFYEIIALSNVVLPADLPPRITNLLRGLLTVSIEDRFGAEEVDDWLAGGDPVVHELDADLQTGIAIKVNKKTYRGEREVALAIVENWDLFVSLVESDALQFQWQEPDVAYQQKVREAIERARGLEPEWALVRIVRAVWPQAGHVFRGRRYETDQELGRAMLTAQGEDIADFAAYLQAHGLTSWQEIRPGAGNPALLQEVEKLAAMKPVAAVRTCGSCLAGSPLPMLEVVQDGRTVKFSRLTELVAFLHRALERSVESYLAHTAYDLPPITPIPGIYASDDRSQLAVVQFDGSVIGDANSLQERLTLNADLNALLSWALPANRLMTTLDVTEDLYAHLLRENRVQFHGITDTGRQGTPWENLLRFMSLFAEFRLQHGADDLFDRYFGRVRQLLDRVASVSLPRLDGDRKEGAPSVTAAKKEIHAAISRFDATRDFADAFMAALKIPDGLSVLSEISHANKAAAFHVISVFEHVFSSRDERLHRQYDTLMGEYAGTLSSAGRLMEFMQRLQQMDSQVLQARSEDFSRFLLSEEVEIFRERMARQGNRLDYVVPDTVNADESFAHLQEWARRSTANR